MPIRVRIERVGYYQDFPDNVIHDITIMRTDEVAGNDRKYTFNGGEVWHRQGAGVEALVTAVLEKF